MITQGTYQAQALQLPSGIPADLMLLAHQTTRQGNPILTAMLYPHCPHCAHQFANHVRPDAVYDGVSHVLTDFQTRRKLRDLLETQYDLAAVLPFVSAYLHEIKSAHALGVAMSMEAELSVWYQRDPNAASMIVGLQDKLAAFGGSEINVIRYVRHIANTIWTWLVQMQIPFHEPGSPPEPKHYRIMLTAPGTDYEIEYPVWGWEVTRMHEKHLYLGLVVSGRDGLDSLRFALVSQGKLLDGPESISSTHLYGLDADTGAAYPYNIPVAAEQAVVLVPELYRAALSGPSVPLGALRSVSTCKSCGYYRACFGPDKLPKAKKSEVTGITKLPWVSKSKETSGEAQL